MSTGLTKERRGRPLTFGSKDIEYIIVEGIGDYHVLPTRTDETERIEEHGYWDLQR